MTVSTNAMEIVETMIKGVEKLEYYTEAGRMEDLSFDCLAVMRELEGQIEEEVHSDEVNAKNLLELSAKLADYTQACDYFREEAIALDKKTEEEMTMTEKARLQEVIQSLHLTLDGVEYDGKVDRFNDYRFECLNVVENIEMAIEESVASDDESADNVDKVFALSKEVLVYLAAADHFAKKAALAKEEEAMEEEGPSYYDVLAEVVEEDRSAVLADEEVVVEEETVVTAAADVADVEEEVTMTEEQVVEVEVVEEVKPGTQEAALLELRAALQTRHVELTAKFEDALATAKYEVANGSVEVAAIYRDMTALLEQQLQEVEAKLAKANKQLTKLRVAKVVAAPVIATVVAAKAVVRVVRVVASAVRVVGRFVVSAAKKLVAVVGRVFSKKAPVVATATDVATVTPAAKAKAVVAGTVGVAGVVVTRTASGARKVVGAVKRGYARVSTFVLGASIVIASVGHKAGRVLNTVASVVQASFAAGVSKVKGLGKGGAVA